MENERFLPFFLLHRGERVVDEGAKIFVLGGSRDSKNQWNGTETAGKSDE